ncbi:D-Ala-D-Ala carboxypeptidase family metallohydrolase [Sphingomicrobium aquimarinum]|uniref:D-Ala-D-Ala carboxypeptidase family metallohydrolase n=1 Tax=Sphingomicrobium aquimarinum TaxID=3133971 RepID=UPI003D70DC8A
MGAFRSPFDLGYNVTSGRRTAAGNRAVGGVSGSHHLSGRAFDAVPKGGQSFGQLAALLRRDYPGAEVLIENDHVHVEGLPHGSIPYFGKRGTR